MAPTRTDRTTRSSRQSQISVPTKDATTKSSLSSAEKKALAELQRRQRAEAKAQEEQRQADIRARADAMNDEDENENTPSSPAAQANDDLDVFFGKGRVVDKEPVVNKGRNVDNDTEIQDPSDEENNGHNSDVSSPQDNHFDTDDEGAAGAAQTSDEMDVEDDTPVTPLPRRRRRSVNDDDGSPLRRVSRQGLPRASSSRVSTARTAADKRLRNARARYDDSLRRRSGKITTSMFSPTTKVLAAAAKKVARKRAALENAYPSFEDKDDFYKESVRQAAMESSFASPHLEAAYGRLLNDEEKFHEVCTYSRYGGDAFINSYSGKGKTDTPTRYGFDDKTPAGVVKKRSNWLIEAGHFKYGSVDPNALTFNANEPFGSSIFLTLPRLEFFISKAPANSEIFREMLRTRMLPAPTFALTATVYEFAIGLWSEGICVEKEFTAAVAPRYYHHLATFNKLQEKAPKYTARLMKSAFEHMLTNSNLSYMLNEVVDEYTLTNFEAIEDEARLEDGLEAEALAYHNA